MQLHLFELPDVEAFGPLGATRHLSDLLVGTMTFRRRLERLVGGEATLHLRPHLREVYSDEQKGVDADGREALVLAATLLPEAPTLRAMVERDGEWIMRDDSGIIVAARLSADRFASLDHDAPLLDLEPLGSLPPFGPAPAAVRDIWSLVLRNGASITGDLALLEEDGLVSGGELPPGVHVVGNGGLFRGDDVVISPGVVIDTSGGAVVLDAGVRIMPCSYLEGPLYVGRGTLIKAGAKIYGSSSIGTRCKVGGEVEGSILLGYANKQHDGFLGHSYLGEWVNLGADTNTSDLKNNYSTVRVRIGGEERETGGLFAGSFIGDHAKTGINTMLNTGTMVGVAANVFGGGFPPKEIPPFAWGEEGTYRVDQAVETARRVMLRRGVEMTPAYDRLLRYLHGSGG